MLSHRRIAGFALKTVLFLGLAMGAPGIATAQIVAENPLVIAVESGDIAAVEQELLAGLSANERSIRGVPALVVAARVADVRMVEFLLERGARVDVPARKDGMTALAEAAERGRADIAQVLIDAGADPDKWTKNGDTPMLIAARRGHAGVVEVLIAAGAYVNDTDRTGRTPLMLAEERNHQQVTRLLRDAGAE